MADLLAKEFRDKPDHLFSTDQYHPSTAGYALAGRNVHVITINDYLARRAELGQVSEIEGVSAGGMPTRVKCLHVLVAHSLSVGPGINPLGDEAIALLGDDWWKNGCCGAVPAEEGK